MSKHITPNPARRRLIGAAAATCLLTVSRIGFAADSTVVAIRLWPSSTYTRLTIEATQALKFKQLRLSNPERLVVDIQGVQLNSLLQNIGQQINANDPYIKSIRAGQFDPNTVRQNLYDLALLHALQSVDFDAAQIKALPLSREVKESSFTECNMMSNVSHSGG